MDKFQEQVIINKDIEPFNKLITKRAYDLIRAEKYPSRPLSKESVYNAVHNVFGSIIPGDNECVINDNDNDIEYKFDNNIKNVNVFSIGLRFTKEHFFLIRFDFVSPKHLPHTNRYQDGTSKKIYGNHVHIISGNDKYVPKNVIPIGDIKEFKNLKNIKDTFDYFVKFTNIHKN